MRDSFPCEKKLHLSYLSVFRVKSICLLNEQVVFDDVYDTTHGALVGIVHDQVSVIMVNKLFKQYCGSVTFWYGSGSADPCL
jgi:hypothetical protein